MPIPDYQTLMLPVLQAFADGATKVADCLPRLKTQFGISDEEAETLVPSGKKTLLADRAHWARTYLSKAGLLTSPRRNQHVITVSGRALLNTRPVRISNETLAQYDGFSDWKVGGPAAGTSLPEATAPIVAEIATPDEQIDSAFRQIETALKDELLAATLALSPQRFEQLIIDLLLAMGYGGGDVDMGERLGRSGDGGIDGIINEDKLGLDAVYVQAKRYAIGSNIGRPALQAFVGSLTGEGATKGVFVTTSDFSKEAHDYLRKVQHRIVLINGERLARLMIQYEVGARARQSYVLRSLDEDYFSDN